MHNNDFDGEEAFLGITPALTYDPPEAAQIASGIISSEHTFSGPNHPSNAAKWEYITRTLRDPSGEPLTLCSPVPMDDIFNEGNPGPQQAAMFLSDLRHQYINRLIDADLYDMTASLMWLWRNKYWQVRMREQLALHLQCQESDSPVTEH